MVVSCSGHQLELRCEGVADGRSLLSRAAEAEHRDPALAHSGGEGVVELGDPIHGDVRFG